MQLPGNFEEIVISYILPLGIIIIVMKLKNWKKITRSTGIDFMIASILFCIVILHSPSSYEESIGETFRSHIVWIYILLILFEIFILLFCMDVEKRIQNRYNSIVVNNFIREKNLAIPQLDDRYKFSLAVKEFLSWLFVCGLIGFNIYMFLVP